MSSSSNLYSQGFGTTSSALLTAVVKNSAPGVTDVKGEGGQFPIGKRWVNKSDNTSYTLTSFSSQNGVVTGNWVLEGINSGDLETLGSDSGTATPTLHKIDIVGAGDLSTAASGDTITISFSAGTTAIDTINGNTGSVAPVAGAVTISGDGTSVAFSGAAATLSAAFDAELSGASITSIGGTRHSTALGVGNGTDVSVFDTTLIGFDAGAVNASAGSTAVGSGAMVSNTSGTKNSAFGFGALGGNSTTNNNTALGYNAATAVTVANTTAVGAEALATVSVGADNTAVGQSALTLSTAAENTAIGSGCLESSVTGTALVGVGYNVLSDSTGSNNTAMGHSCMSLAAAGDRNTAVGAATLIAVHTASDNTFFGAGLGTLLTSGNQNTVVGSVSLLACVTGANNAGLGYNVLAGATSSNNVAIGSTAGSAMTSGGSNTLVGFGSGTGLLTGGSNVCVGISSGSAYVGAETNNIVIGASLAGTAAESNAIRIGNATAAKTYIAAIRGVTTDNADAVAVLVDSADQMGTVSSSIRYKEDVESLENSSRIYDLRPVTFKYKSQVSTRPQFGLIAEEVDKVIPEIVVRNAEGQVDTLQYQTLPIFLLAEIQKLKKEIEALKVK